MPPAPSVSSRSALVGGRDSPLFPFRDINNAKKGQPEANTAEAAAAAAAHCVANI